MQEEYRYNPFYAEAGSPAPAFPQGDPGPFQSQQGPPFQGQPGQSGGTGGGRTGVVVIVVVLVVLLVAGLGVLAATRWDSLFGGGSATAPVTTTVVVPADNGSSDAPQQTSSQSADRGRPTSASLPAGVTPVNDAARNGAPTGNFNSVWLSGPTTEGFAVVVRDAYVTAYMADRKTDQSVVAVSPTTRQSYTMTCRDTGSYIHCTGGNNANVYIA